MEKLKRKKLKRPNQRKPEESIPWSQVLSEVREETGFVRSDIENVLLAYLDRMRFHILDRKRVRIKGIGELYVVVKPGRTLTNLAGNKSNVFGKVTVDPKWKIMFATSESIEAEVNEMVVTRKDLSRIYN
jgi:nucleoid DNA-binding protein